VEGAQHTLALLHVCLPVEMAMIQALKLQFWVCGECAAYAKHPNPHMEHTRYVVSCRLYSAVQYNIMQ
jgi:hypothetical protein